MKAFNRNRPKFIVYASTIILILLFSIYQFQSYKTDGALTDQQLRLNTLRGRMIYLDEALTMSARLYILEKDTTWKKRYDRFAIDYVSSLEEINKKLPHSYNGKKELIFASDQLFALETKAFGYANQNLYNEARSILFGPYYMQQSKDYQTALSKLTLEIDDLSNELLSTHKEKTIIQSLLALLILLGVVTGWSFYNHVSNKWHKKINQINIEKAEAAIAAEEKLKGLNAQLRLLSAHLQEVREKEKQHIAYEISEELGQQLMAFKMNYTTNQRQLLDGETLPLNLIQKANDQLDSVLLYLNELALDVYPSILKDLGLIEALSWEIEKLATQKAMSIIFFTEEDDLNVENSVAIKIFRIVQDKLRNLIFNKASDIIVSLSVEDQNIVLSFDHNANQDMAIYGNVFEQVIMEEYLKSINGKIRTNTSTGGDNNFTIVIPLTEYYPSFY